MDEIPGLEKLRAALPGGSRIVYRAGGPPAGKAVVLLHGGGTDHGLLSWRETIPPLLEAGFRVFAPDYPGYGESPRDGHASTIEHLQRCLAGLMAHWRLERATLVGVSLGGALAIGHALAHPGQVRRLVLVGSYGIQDRAPYHALSFMMVRLPWLMRGLWSLARGSRAAARYSLNSIVRSPQARSEALLEEVWQAVQNRSSQEAFLEMQRDDVRWHGLKTNFSGRLGEIEAPVLMVHGSHDLGVPLRWAQRAAGRLKHGQLAVFEDAGHWTQRDQPERFNRLLLEFLGDHPADAPRPRRREPARAHLRASRSDR